MNAVGRLLYFLSFGMSTVGCLLFLFLFFLFFWGGGCFVFDLFFGMSVVGRLLYFLSFGMNTVDQLLFLWV